MSATTRSIELKNILQCSDRDLIKAERLLTQANTLEHDHRIITSKSLSHSTNDYQPAFIALRGTKFSGEDFVLEILDHITVAIVSFSFLTSLKNKNFNKEKKNQVTKKLILITDTNLVSAKLAAWFYCHPSKKMKVIGVTGTNGKTTVSCLLESLYGQRVGLIGTLGVKIKHKLCDIIPLTNTTANAVDNQKILHAMYREGVNTVIMEVSSHALSVGRVEQIHFDSVLFTNLSPEHLDFHNTMEDYWLAKHQIFELLKISNKPHKKAVVSLKTLKPYSFFNLTTILKYENDFQLIFLEKKTEKSSNFLNYSSEPKSNIKYFNYTTEYLKKKNLDRVMLVTLSQSNKIEKTKKIEGIKIQSNLIGEHNGENLALSILEKNHEIIRLEESIKKINLFIPGRMERMYYKSHLVYVDFAHTPDALEIVLKSLLIFNKKIICIFGCGGDRDKLKRPLMGAIAEENSHQIILTNDNPRHEDPQTIIKEIISGIKKKSNKIEVILDRKTAIQTGLNLLENNPDSLLLIAGKGHEDYQILGDKKVFFSDKRVVEDFSNNSLR